MSLMIIVLPTENNHVLDAAADEEFTVMHESHVAGPKIAIVIGAIIDQPGMKQLHRQLGIIPKTRALTSSRDPDLADAARLESDVLLWIDDLYRETRQRSSATDNLSGRADF